MITLEQIGKIRQAQKREEARWPWWKKIHSAIKKAFVRTEEWPNEHSRANGLRGTVKELSDAFEESWQISVNFTIPPKQSAHDTRTLINAAYRALYDEFGDEIEEMWR